jgi:hypothetical protein
VAEDRNWDDVWKGNGNVVDWRLPSGATEDRNINQYRANIGHPRGWRSPFRATENRNQLETYKVAGEKRVAVVLREAAGDRNVDTFTGGDELSTLAVVLRSGLGSQRVIEDGPAHLGLLAVALWGGRGSQLTTGEDPVVDVVLTVAFLGSVFK